MSTHDITLSVWQLLLLDFERFLCRINRERPTRILIQLLVLEEVGSLSQRAEGEWMAQNKKQGTIITEPAA